ncbi:MAG: cob(I)yrinic acid a,c-diamide adenosyltransferase [Phycisphaerales bacterium]|nr:cob(I)yrinic acid a,c-diamide adenosyltransferase [Phycisphaerales bacterium]
MVKLNRIYTRTGDDGTTGLGDGTRVPKHDLRVAAYGAVDECNAAIGMAITEGGRGAHPFPLAGELVLLLSSIQNDLFDVGADLCCPIGPQEAPGTRLRVSPAQTQRLESAIDRYNARLRPLDSFVLPGGSAFAAALHVARTVTRRAERDVVSLLLAEPGPTNGQTVHYLNRLSDLLFVLARVANSDGATDIKWIPGANRST